MRLDFVVSADETEVATASIRYLLAYELSGAEAPNSEDLIEFARANGALHSWPFVRELVYGLTARWGYPPFTLPVIHFVGRAADDEANDGAEEGENDPSSQEINGEPT